MWGRPLAGGGAAVVFFNRGELPAEIAVGERSGILMTPPVNRY